MLMRSLAHTHDWIAHNVSLAGAISRTRDVQIVCVFLSDSLPHPPPSLARYLGVMLWYLDPACRHR